ncbi:hypothetical protein [Sphingobium sp. CR28]|uniref:hypothetical protein n=1 Tax=Sphingobium sp. CR28 TaxID=3400272 RepID=UPI003FF13921
MKIIIALLSVAALGGTASAQQAPQVWVGRELPPSTMIVLTPDQEVTSKKVEVGDIVNFTVVGDVVENGAVAIRRGTHAEGKVSWKTGRAIGGKSGKFEIAFSSITLNGRQYPLRGTHRQEGRGNTTAALLGSILISGRSAQMLPGQLVNAFTVSSIPY